VGCLRGVILVPTGRGQNRNTLAPGQKTIANFRAICCTLPH
jgi:hypothetical protein